MKIAFLVHCNSLVVCKVYYDPSKKSHKAKSFCQQLNKSEINYAISQTGFAESRACFFLSMLMDSLSIKQNNKNTEKQKPKQKNQKTFKRTKYFCKFCYCLQFWTLSGLVCYSTIYTDIYIDSYIYRLAVSYMQCADSNNEIVSRSRVKWTIVIAPFACSAISSSSSRRNGDRQEEAAVPRWPTRSSSAWPHRRSG